MTDNTPTPDVVTLEVITRPAELEHDKRRRVRDPLSAYGANRSRAVWQTFATSTDPEGWEHYAWTVRLHYQGRSMESPWRAGIAHVTKTRRVHYPGEHLLKPTEPTAADLLESLMLDASSYENAGSFEEWATDYGMDTDSRKAAEVYDTCGRLARDLARLLGGRPWQSDEEDVETIARRLAGTPEEVTTA